MLFDTREWQDVWRTVSWELRRTLTRRPDGDRYNGNTGRLVLVSDWGTVLAKGTSPYACMSLFSFPQIECLFCFWRLTIFAMVLHYFKADFLFWITQHTQLARSSSFRESNTGSSNCEIPKWTCKKFELVTNVCNLILLVHTYSHHTIHYVVLSFTSFQVSFTSTKVQILAPEEHRVPLHFLYEYKITGTNTWRTLNTFFSFSLTHRHILMRY